MNGNYPYSEVGAYMSEGFSLKANLVPMLLSCRSSLQEHSFLNIDIRTQSKKKKNILAGEKGLWAFLFLSFNSQVQSVL